jgi:hypothetical protein
LVITIGVVTPPQRMENGKWRIKNEEKEEPIG